jgi:hypothetical protein
LDGKESEKHKVDLERMEKMPLKTKGKKDESDKRKKKKKKKKKDTGKDKSPREEGRKKGTFAETVGKEKVNKKVIRTEQLRKLGKYY